MTEREALMTLALVPRVGGVTVRRLVGELGSAQAVFSVPAERLRRIPGVGPTLSRSIRTFPWRKALAEEERLAKKGGLTMVCWGDPGYPSPLVHIASPPLLLYCRGRWEERDRRAVAIVGSRRASPYGLSVGEALAADLASRGVTVVSGLARGIDSAAHRGALRAGGRTIAILGSGLGRIYPAENRDLAEQIASSGALLSEFPVKAPPLPAHFPQRNRLISGLALGVVVVEAAEDSGALITAECALEQGREVFAVPGSVTAAGSKGVHRLLKSGAKLVEGWEDVWEEIAPQMTPPPRPRPPSEASPPLPTLTGEEKRLSALLSEEPLHIDLVISRSGLPAGRVASLLFGLVMKGCARELPGKFFVGAGSGGAC